MTILLSDIYIPSVVEVSKIIDGIEYSEDGKILIECQDKSKTSVEIPNSVTTIESSAFMDCKSLKFVKIPQSVISIADEAFGAHSMYTANSGNQDTGYIKRSHTKYTNLGCSSLLSISVDSNNTKYQSIDGVLFSKSGTELIQYPVGRTDKSYSIPTSVETIGNCAFKGCLSLVSVCIPDSVKSIGD